MFFVQPRLNRQTYVNSSPLSGMKSYNIVITDTCGTFSMSLLEVPRSKMHRNLAAQTPAHQHHRHCQSPNRMKLIAPNTLADPSDIILLGFS